MFQLHQLFFWLLFGSIDASDGKGNNLGMEDQAVTVLWNRDCPLVRAVIEDRIFFRLKLYVFLLYTCYMYVVKK